MRQGCKALKTLTRLIYQTGQDLRTDLQSTLKSSEKGKKMIEVNLNPIKEHPVTKRAAGPKPSTRCRNKIRPNFPSLMHKQKKLRRLISTNKQTNQYTTNTTQLAIKLTQMDYSQTSTSSLFYSKETVKILEQSNLEIIKCSFNWMKRRRVMREYLKR